MNAVSSSSSVILTEGEKNSSKSKQMSSSLTLRSPSKRTSSETSRVYQQASQLYLTRRLPESLSVLEPLFTPVRSENEQNDDTEETPSEAPIANATTVQCIKVWALYISLLNSILDLGYDEGKRLFGRARYKEMVALVCNGDIWETVVRDGYRGREGSVDAEVVYNLATLLLKQAPSQTVNQSRLESFLSCSANTDTGRKPDLDPGSSHWRQSDICGAKTPKDLEARVRVLELFTLHVLPKNEQWDYAEFCISMSDMLDDERRDTFLQTLQELKEIQDAEHQEEEQQKVAKLQTGSEDKQRGELNRTDLGRHLSWQNGSAHQRKSSEIDYGIEKRPPKGHAEDRSGPQTSCDAPSATSTTAAARSHFQPPAESPRNHKIRKPAQRPPSSYFHQVVDLCRRLQNLMGNMMVSNPSTLLKILISVLAIIMAFSKRDVRERSRQVVLNGWEKFRGTVGMGVKVSYI